MGRVAVKQQLTKRDKNLFGKHCRKFGKFLPALAVTFFVSSIGLSIWLTYVLYFYPHKLVSLVKPQQVNEKNIIYTEYNRRFLCTTNDKTGVVEWDVLDYSQPPYYEDISSSCSTYNHFTYKVHNLSMDDYTHDLYLTSKLLADKMNREWVVFLDGKEIFRAAHYRFVPYYLWSYDDCFRIDWHYYGNNYGYSIFFDESGRIIDNCPKSQNYSQ